MSQMFAVAKLAGMACKVKPKRPRQRETELGGSDTHNLRWRAGIGSKHADLNYSNRPVRTRMPGGVGGARSGILTAPIPICGSPGERLAVAGLIASLRSGLLRTDFTGQGCCCPGVALVAVDERVSVTAGVKDPA